MRSLPKVLLVGGPDVDARLELMQRLKSNFEVGALGSHPQLRERFSSQGFEYGSYALNRNVNPLTDLRTLGQLVLLFKKMKPHIVHTFDTKPGIWGRLAARLAGVPIVIGTVTGLGSLYSSNRLPVRLTRRLFEGLQRLACNCSDMTIFQNHDDARQFIRSRIVSSQKVQFIPGSGVSSERFAPGGVSETDTIRIKKELGIRSGEVVVTMISRVIRSKGVLEFMAAAKEIGSNARFVLIGPNDEESPDRLSAAELENLKRTLTWPGPRRDISAVLALSDIFVLPSAYREGIPRVLLEAAAVGLPIVTTNSPGCNEVVEHDRNGLLVPIGDAPALTLAIRKLVEDADLRRRFGKTSRQRAVDEFDLSVIAGQTQRIYRQLLSQKGL